MIIGFSVSNFRSFNNTQSISFLSSKISRHKDHIIATGNKKILKSGLVFGANASGKSNLIEAIYFSRKIILQGTNAVNMNKQYFRIISDNYHHPGVFEYRIYCNQKEYSYGVAISYETNEILGEWLVRIANNGSETYLFNREIDEKHVSHVETQIKFKTKEEQLRYEIYLEDFGENISEPLRKKTILSDIALRSNEKKGIFSEIFQVFNWFQKMIILFPDSKYDKLNDIASQPDTREYFSSIMQYFDTGIESIESEKEPVDFDKIFNSIPAEIAEQAKINVLNQLKDYATVRIADQVYTLRKDKNGEIFSTKMKLNHGNDDDLFEYADESDGSKRLFDLVPLFYSSKSNCVILIDEIDRSLHSNLTRCFLELFFALTKNNRAQLIATTHDSNLLDLELMRQDEIWFVEREEDHNSALFSLNKFRQRFDKIIDKDYLLGRYGAVPFFDRILEEKILEGVDDE